MAEAMSGTSEAETETQRETSSTKERSSADIRFILFMT